MSCWRKLEAAKTSHWRHPVSLLNNWTLSTSATVPKCSLLEVCSSNRFVLLYDLTNPQYSGVGTKSALRDRASSISEGLSREGGVLWRGGTAVSPLTTNQEVCGSAVSSGGPGQSPWSSKQEFCAFWVLQVSSAAVMRCKADKLGELLLGEKILSLPRFQPMIFSLMVIRIRIKIIEFT